MLYTDIPTADEFAALDAARGDICVSIYLPTSPVTRATKADRILLKNLASSAIDQLVKAKANKRRVAAIADSLAELESDRQFWAYLADGLAIFVTPGAMRTFRLPHAPEPEAQVSDRFHIKPLVPTLAQQGHCFVLALSQGAVRLIEITPSFAKQVKAADLPKTMSQVLKRRFPRDPAPARRIQGGEGMKVLMGQYCRAIDRALRPVLMSQTAPLILASVSELAAIYRAHNSYPALEKSVITGNPEELTDAELAAKARPAVSRLEKEEFATGSPRLLMVWIKILQARILRKLRAQRSAVRFRPCSSTKTLVYRAE